jgi:Tfp pilus assembly protein PilW
MTLVETLFSVGIGVLVLSALGSFLSYTGKSMVGLNNYVELERQSQLALDTMTRDIRQTKCLDSYDTNKLVFRDSDDALLTFEYKPDQKILTRSKNGVVQQLLSECDFLCFSNFQRNPVEGTFDQYPVTLSPTNTKLVSVTWVCSRTIVGSKMNTESVQTAKIVIRKQ